MSETWHPGLEELSAVIDGELAADELRLVRDHVLQCGACRERASRLAGTSRLVALLPPEEAPEELVRRVAAAARTSGRSHRWMRWATAAAALLGALAVFRVVQETNEPAMMRLETFPVNQKRADAAPEPPARMEARAPAEVKEESRDAESSRARVGAAANGSEAAADRAQAVPSQRAAEPAVFSELAIQAQLPQAESSGEAEALSDARLARAEPAAPPAASLSAKAGAAPSFEADAAASAAPRDDDAGTCGRVRRRPEERPMAAERLTEQPVLLKRNAPAWPAPAAGAAEVHVQAIVEIDGTLSACRVSPELSAPDRAALDAALAGWRWRPARLDGRPQAAWTEIVLPR